MKKNGLSPIYSIFLAALVALLVVFFYLKNDSKVPQYNPVDNNVPGETTSSTPNPKSSSTPIVSNIDIKLFQDFSKTITCSNKRNNLYVIDNKIVFLAQESNCADDSYSYTLFGETPDVKLCTYHDSIAGPRIQCSDESYKIMFDIINANNTKEDLGLGATHQVVKVQ